VKIWWSGLVSQLSVWGKGFVVRAVPGGFKSGSAMKVTLQDMS